MVPKKWALRPGEQKLENAYVKESQKQKEHRYKQLVHDYLQTTETAPIILDSHKEVVYFIHHDEGSIEHFTHAEVALYDGFDYIYVTKPLLAYDITKQFLSYLDKMSEAYDYIDSTDQEL